MHITLTLAVADNGVIGRRDGSMPWRQSTDLAHFKQLTWGHPVIMGRKTFESIGHPLPGRTTIVVTRNHTYSAQGIEVVHSLDQAIAKCTDTDEVFVIGGAELFSQAEPLAQTCYLTEIHSQPEGEVVYSLSPTWIERERVNYPADADNQYPYSFVLLTR